ncbi:hypothetical protein A2313_03265 [Candidatus Roizmanbacteria bacterium RIFOXYB2_FULL_41_10]|uniref:Transglutaminase-like domain-containing protein n=1 Tax=Candidatus Roizmanbacteria bacterium RIFOXYA1_FULL_41_12 TaxID=1802082 RepID=A0A1F7K9V9_9BACT|nr:MAG: hypothetical protein A2262_02950 [Candidatus Roizmanbacteria bacterium RIFOXYA2_FULL_41_8]OGK64659.1 MAG: hypothetical protein A2209_03665 [Candidatus Roizmanbacteria bacterium RIFOXYA1_FULL_41_12]OGK67205.1 MAG: hypothetical protein A2377_01045 [Candidatus Roizmanbacteria bacterium RIFOXYB1_FULL_41_27]OGK72267.1 MAG: hypothetical protein A2313_03265 [Candidatus Roizmanbacteria bacterium RIFOXYB2_FULL_41_10]OGK72459.1 MAG: hypothetical protein A2403_03050 [Candidatus Roizmanbacteria bac
MKNNWLKIFLLFFIWLVLFGGSAVFAQGSQIIQTRYFDTYTLDYSQNVVVTKQIQLINKTAEMYVSEYELSFSSYARIDSLQVLENDIPATFTQTKTSDLLKIRIKFQQPAIGKGAIKDLKLIYVLPNYLNQAGAHRELLIPLSGSSDQEELLAYDVKMVVPEDYPEIGISKPKIDRLDTTSYQWSNLVEFEKKAVYVSFADRAYYQVKLNYILANKAPYARTLDIALVPDGTFQKTYLSGLEPQPTNVYSDPDGNLMASYRVPGQTVLKVLYQGYVELLTKAREEVRQYQQQAVRDRNTRYLTQEDYWFLSPSILADSQIKDLDSSLGIYNYVVDKLQYNTARINPDLKRQGAEWVYVNPNQAVCMEYSDLFIALSREKGIPAREVVGYAITADEGLLPLSFLGDVLHAWPEYFDSARQYWLAVDPTWGDTSGIDYFRSLDLSHIAFVYHGKNPDSPLPPGVYKLDPQSRDIIVMPVASVPETKTDITGAFDGQLLFNAGEDNQVTAVLQSEANVIQYSVELALRQNKGQKILSTRTIKLIEPLSKKEIVFKINKDRLRLTNGQTLQLLVNNRVVTEKSFTVLPPIWYFLRAYGFWLILPAFLIVGFYLVKWRF